MLHFGPRSQSFEALVDAADPSTSDAGASSSAPNAQSLATTTSVLESDSVVLLSTVQAEALDVHGRPFPVRILLDSASQANFVTENCMQQGGYSRSGHRASIMAVGDTRAATTRGRTSLVIRSRRCSDLRFPIEATILARISARLPNRQIRKKPWKHLEGLRLADPEYYRPNPVDVLIGADIFASLLRDGRCLGDRGEPDAFNTVFGWVLTGAVSPSMISPVQSFLTLDSIDDSVRKFWELEEVPQVSSLSEEDRQCEELFGRITRRAASGRFIVSYPFTKDNPCFVDSRLIAINRFRALERRFKSDPSFKLDYSKFMREYLDLGHMELVRQPFPVDGPVFYLPHHGVIKADSTTTKLRVVFDASAQCPNGLSLNQTLLTGPKLHLDVMAVLLRFRIGAVAITADVKQMFRQVWLDSRQCDYQRVVWHFSERDRISDYRLKTVTFGVAPSPYLAIRCLLQLATEGETKYPLASAALKSSLYVDDVVASASSTSEARELRDQLQSLLGGAGFELRKWASSHSAVLAGLEPDLCNNSLLSFEPVEEPFLKVLGLHWYAKQDSFGFQVNTLHRGCTKRTILSELARIFDPLGFLAPLTFAAKRLVQELWKLKLDWDDPPPPELCSQWERFQAELSALESIRIVRTIAVEGVSRRELHGFCDASERGYGAVVYLRIAAAQGTVIRMLGAKWKVAPLKALTIPKLELCAAVLLADLLSYIQNIFSSRVLVDAIYAWSDSMVVLSWLRAAPHCWPTFVRNRVARIQANSAISGWRHVPSESNPADCCSRGSLPQELVNHPLWWTGPAWLVEFDAPSEIILELGDPSEKKEDTITFMTALADRMVDSLLTRFSSLEKIIRIVAYCLRFADGTRSRPIPRTMSVDQLESHSALLRLVGLVQSDCFSEEIDRLRRGKVCSKEL